MSRYVPDGFVLLEEAYKEIIGKECEFVSKDCLFTKEEQKLLLLLKKRKK